MKSLFRGTATAMITPFTEDGVDYVALEKQIEYQIENGIEALVVLGTTGEPSTLTDAEYEQVARFCLEKINKRVKVIIGTGSNCTKKAIEKSKFAESIGADGVLAVTPYYNKCTQNGLIKYYQDISDAINIPIICYNVPARTGVNILPQTMNKIADIKNVYGIKEACGNMEQICETARLIRGKCALYSGDDNLNLAMLSIGSEGLISVASNIAPKEVGLVAKLYFKGENEKAVELQERLLPLIDQMFTEVNPIPVKMASYYVGLGSSIVRAPLTELEDEHKLTLKKALKDFGFTIKE
jgi:4-hydroxy-tetrahydrodipicolinate synthase